MLASTRSPIAILYDPATLRVFEVDHPATQAWKRQLLAAAAIPIPSAVTYAPIDFERDTLADGLAQGQFDPRIPTFFSSLGVTMYLTREAVDATLRFVAQTPEGGGMVFDYGVSKSRLGWSRRFALGVLSRHVAAAGEPFKLCSSRTTLPAASIRSAFARSPTWARTS